MPELPEVETVRLGLEKQLLGVTVEQITVRQGSLRWPVPLSLADKMQGQQFRKISRRGKYLLFDMSNGVMLAHLGMSGVLWVCPQQEALKKHDHVIFNLAEGLSLRYHDPRRFGCIDWVEGDPYQHRLLKHLGPEPLESGFDAKYLYSSLQKQKRAIKSAIMDHKLVVGIGNIYAAEALFALRIHPQTPANTLSYAQCCDLVHQSRALLQSAIKQGGTTLRDFINPEKKPGYFKQSLAVYGRKGQPCHICGESICSVVIGQRASAFCAQCQKI